MSEIRKKLMPAVVRRKDTSLNLPPSNALRTVDFPTLKQTLEHVSGDEKISHSFFPDQQCNT
jgi:hypothetical protein